MNDRNNANNPNDPNDQNSLVAALRTLNLFDELTDAELQTIAGQGNAIFLDTGDIHREEGDPAEHVFILLEGEIQVTQRVGAQEVLLATYGPRTLFGELPLLMGIDTFFARGRATQPTRVFEFTNEVFWQILRTYSSVSIAVLRTMAARVQHLASISQQREKLASLGELAAGLAHELNNPAAAARRAVENLRGSLQELHAHSRTLSRQLTTPQLEALAAHEETATASAANPPALDALTRSDREDTIIDWLDDHAVAGGWQLAPTFVMAGLAVDWLEAVARDLPTDALTSALRYLELLLTVNDLLDNAESSTGRVSDLVAAMKAYSYMDQAPLQEVDVQEALEHTLTILNHKLKHGIEVTRDYAPDLPKVWAYGSELNQVWTNLIDNAIDAMEGQDRPAQLHVRTWLEGERVQIEICDNGCGIAPDILPRIFEPFFTTKEVGQGSGLGLDVAYRIVVAQHAGDIRVKSEPGDTRFQVCLPVRVNG